MEFPLPEALGFERKQRGMRLCESAERLSDASLPFGQKKGDKETTNNSISEPAETRNKILIDAHKILTEEIPTVIIEPNIESLPNSIYCGKLFNPGKTPNLEKLGLALSQVAAAAFLFKNFDGNENKKRTPMITEINSLNLSPMADQRFESGELLDLEVDMSGGDSLFTGRVKLDNFVLCEAEMRIMPLPLNEKILDRLRRQSPKIDWEEPTGESLPDLSMPGFGGDWMITNRVRGEHSEHATVVAHKGLFEGHFPQVDIIPIAGSASPGFWLAKNHFSDMGHEGHSEVLSIKELSIPAPLKPNDVLDYRLTGLDKPGFYKIEVFFRDGDDRRLAAEFGEIELGVAKRKQHLWQHPNVAKAFAAQGQIPTYPDHIKKVVNEAVVSVASLDQQELRIADIGTGIGRVVEQVLSSEDVDLSDRNIEVHLTDVSSEALRLASDNLERRFEVLMDGRLQLATTLVTEDGVIIPEDLGSQDVIMGNFSFYGNLDKAFTLAYKKLNPNGVLILGMIHENPNYNLLMLNEAGRMKSQFDPYQYRQDLVMSDIGLDLCEDALLHKGQCEYVSPEQCQKKLRQAGFNTEVVEDSSFCGIGYIIKATKA